MIEEARRHLVGRAILDHEVQALDDYPSGVKQDFIHMLCLYTGILYFDPEPQRIAEADQIQQRLENDYQIGYSHPAVQAVIRHLNTKE